MTTVSQTMEAPIHLRADTSFIKPNTSHLDRCAYLVGNPIAHSQSPALHHAIYSSMDKRWGQVLAETTDLHGFIQYLRSDSKSMGSGVTMPFKVAVIPYLDELEPAGQAVGAVNTIFYRQNLDGSRRFVGTNTDVLGVRDAFLNNTTDTSYVGKPGLVVGGGGCGCGCDGQIGCGHGREMERMDGRRKGWTDGWAGSLAGRPAG